MTYPAVTGLPRRHDSEVIGHLTHRTKSLWIMFSTTCSIRCGYCVSNMHKPAVQKRIPLIDQIGFDAYLAKLEPIVYRYWPILQIGGPGEPTLSKHFEPLIHALDRPSVIQTNLTNVAPLLRLIKSRGDVSVIATYHVGACFDRTNPARLRTTCMHGLDALLATGAVKKIIVPLSPPALQHVPEVISDLHHVQGPMLHLRRLSHIYRGKHYPGAYTAAERREFRALVDQLDHTPEYPEPLALMQHMNPKLYLKGMRCYTAMTNVNVDLFGGLWNCYADPFDREALGSLRNGYDVNALYANESSLCPYDVCLCRVGVTDCLAPAGLTVLDYYAEHYRVLGRPDLATLFEAS